ncbi:MAG: 23S rRNA (adenine(2503)-C(2))-methyltransferase RlmN [Firmicutes bacterium]|nr:23S rRNA (adenine(2503)-C(2))-methyltransferase RlmN [Bacillota bacterium]
MINLLDLNKKELEDFFVNIGEKKFRAQQTREWIYRGARDFSEMKNLPGELRNRLEKMQEAGEITLGGLKILDMRSASDGSTAKFLFELHDGNTIETVLMRYKYGNSVCVSSQAGCRMGCRFCASTLLGLQRNLTAGEIVAQVLACLRYVKDENDYPLSSNDERIGHIVIMGTGEPLDNYENVKKFTELLNAKDGLDLSLRNITLSTCGLVPVIKKFTEEMPQVNLAISLHASNNTSRSALMPVNDAYPIDELMPAVSAHARKTGRRVTFEYALTAGVNDSEKQAEDLANLLRHYFNHQAGNGGLCHVNLIPLNKVEEIGMEGSGRKQVLAFQKKLEDMGIPATIRREMGADIDAACGQLRLGKK